MKLMQPTLFKSVKLLLIFFMALNFKAKIRKSENVLVILKVLS